MHEGRHEGKYDRDPTSDLSRHRRVEASSIHAPFALTQETLKFDVWEQKRAPAVSE